MTDRIKPLAEDYRIESDQEASFLALAIKHNQYKLFKALYRFATKPQPYQYTLKGYENRETRHRVILEKDHYDYLMTYAAKLKKKKFLNFLMKQRHLYS